MFCDIRGFSAISESSGPQLTFEWLQDVLTEISQCIIDLDGVLVDYIGDQLFSSWGAPEEQERHPELALRAGVETLKRPSSWGSVPLPREPACEQLVGSRTFVDFLNCKWSGSTVWWRRMKFRARQPRSGCDCESDTSAHWNSSNKVSLLKPPRRLASYFRNSHATSRVNCFWNALSGN